MSTTTDWIVTINPNDTTKPLSGLTSVRRKNSRSSSSPINATDTTESATATK